ALLAGRPASREDREHRLCDDERARPLAAPPEIPCEQPGRPARPGLVRWRSFSWEPGWCSGWARAAMAARSAPMAVAAAIVPAAAAMDRAGAEMAPAGEAMARARDATSARRPAMLARLVPMAHRPARMAGAHRRTCPASHRRPATPSAAPWAAPTPV